MNAAQPQPAPGLRKALEGLVNWWAVGGNGIDAASQDLISACSAELLRVLYEHPDAQPQPAPGTLRADLEATLSDWRDDAVYRLTDTRDEITEHYAVTACADTLAGILADHPETEPQPAPELAGNGNMHARMLALAAEFDDLGAAERSIADRQDDTAARDGALVRARVFETCATRIQGELHALGALEPGQPAPELAAAMAETRKVREILARVFGSFSTPDQRNMRHASITRLTIDRWKTDAGLEGK